LSGLADLRREMEEDESSDRAEAAEQAAQEAIEADEDDAEEAEDDSDEPEDVAEADAETDEADTDEGEADESDEAAFDEASGFPENFPRVSRLENAGVHSIAELREVDDLTELDGIGASYAEDIEEGLQEFDETGKVSS